ncbi:DUF2986 domain-containing protein [Marinomonas sp. RSW2]|uniref:DUF2986 domain-containing protein n=1 Tax=Marinomonas maritima TaxID=2940935 RepID=A0ABT5WFH8_9GAMM|nr:DUF2986 domain-containing protein [Marinomonas maritima]MDE8603575.1 DUF2986 domain-containing protein [Marinomonas maritima]
MNRRKKIKDIYDKRMKQANLKVNPKKAKPKYISKAERERIAAEAATQTTDIETIEATTTTEEQVKKDA